jgi:hypothetical protein
VCSGTIYSGQFTKNNMALVMDGACGSLSIKLETSCSNSPRNVISVTTYDVNVGLGTFFGPVDCSIEGGGGLGNTAASSSMTGTTSTQDSDGDGIPDSSDRCANNSNTRCFKEDTSTQPQSSSSSGNQTS